MEQMASTVSERAADAALSYERSKAPGTYIPIPDLNGTQNPEFIGGK